MDSDHILRFLTKILDNTLENPADSDFRVSLINTINDNARKTVTLNLWNLDNNAGTVTLFLEGEDWSGSNLGGQYLSEVNPLKIAMGPDSDNLRYLVDSTVSTLGVLTVITLGRRDLNYAKQNMQNVLSAWLIMDTDALHLSGNYYHDVENPLAVNTFSPDLTQPVVNRVSYNQNDNTITVDFSEIVQAFRVSGLAFQDAAGGTQNFLDSDNNTVANTQDSDTYTINLSAGTVTTLNGLITSGTAGSLFASNTSEIASDLDDLPATVISDASPLTVNVTEATAVAFDSDQVVDIITENLANSLSAGTGVTITSVAAQAGGAGTVTVNVGQSPNQHVATLTFSSEADAIAFAALNTTGSAVDTQLVTLGSNNFGATGLTLVSDPQAILFSANGDIGTGNDLLVISDSSYPLDVQRSGSVVTLTIIVGSPARADGFIERNNVVYTTETSDNIGYAFFDSGDFYSADPTSSSAISTTAAVPASTRIDVTESGLDSEEVVGLIQENIEVDSDWVLSQIPSNFVDSEFVTAQISIDRVDSDWVESLIDTKVKNASDSDRAELRIPIGFSRADIDMNVGLLTIYLDSDIDEFLVSSPDVTKILVGDDASLTNSYRLTGEDGVQYVANQIRISFNRNDLNELAIDPDIATSAGDSFVRVERGAFNLQANYYFDTEDATSTTLQVNNFDQDTTSPLLDSATFTEKANGTIDMVLNFSEPVVRGSLRIENVNTASATTGGSSYSITADDSDNVTWSSGDRAVTVNLSRTQADGIKIVYSLGNNSLFIDVSSDLVSDFNDNPVTAISDTNRQSVTYNTYKQPITFNATV